MPPYLRPLVTTTNTNLLSILNNILKPHLKGDERKSLIQNLMTQLKSGKDVKYRLSDHTFLILSKEERSIQTLRRYPSSPFPLLSVVEVFRSSIGSLNKDLLSYGIPSRLKWKDDSLLTEDISTHVFLIKSDTMSSSGNNYLKKQYKRLFSYRQAKRYLDYWQLSWDLMSKSWTFRLSCLNSWNPTWYKSSPSSEIQKLFTGLHRILSLDETQHSIRNVWIESPKDKWRQLGIPSKSWRLYLHMLNMFISFLYFPHFSSDHYNGFLYSRGPKSWWEKLLWGDYLTKYTNIFEFDLSSAFPNLQRRYLRTVLLEDGLIPEPIINLLLTHLQSPLIESSEFPTLTSYIENKYNQLWRKSQRSLHMGLGVSPILFMICVKSVVDKLKLLNPDLTFNSYADDWSIYFNIKGLLRLKQQENLSIFYILSHLLKNLNPFIEYYNSHPLLKSAGLIVCKKKSSLVRLNGIWLKPYISLGLKLSCSLNLWIQLLYRVQGKLVPLSLSGWTRGRGSNPLKKKSSTLPSREELSYLHQDGQTKLEFVELLQNYRKYFGLFQSKLYGNSDLKKTKFQLRSNKNSILHQIQLSLRIKKYKSLGIRLDLYNAGSMMNEVFLQIQSKEGLSLKYLLLDKNLERSYKIPWPSIKSNPLQMNIKNPLPPKSIEESNYLDGFKKISELNLSIKDLGELKQEYESRGHWAPS